MTEILEPAVYSTTAPQQLWEKVIICMTAASNSMGGKRSWMVFAISSTACSMPTLGVYEHPRLSASPVVWETIDTTEVSEILPFHFTSHITCFNLPSPPSTSQH